MEDENKILSVRSETKIIIPKFKRIQSNKNCSQKYKILSEEILCKNRHQLIFDEQFINDEDKVDIMNLLNEMENSDININASDNNLNKRKLLATKELLTILNQPILYTYKSKRKSIKSKYKK